MFEIELIFNCQNPNKTEFPFKTDHSSKLIIERIKWLFWTCN